MGLFEVNAKSSSGDKLSDIQAQIGSKGYKVEKKLGQGAYGVVFKAVNTKTNTPTAVKSIELKKLSDNAKNKYLPREIDVLQHCRHENLIQTYEVFRTDTNLFIFMQFASNGDISGYAKKHNGIKENIACKWFLQASAGLSFLHGKLYTTHRDIKTANILLDDNFRALMTDFGFAKKSFDTQKNAIVMSRTYCGTKPYESPEIVEHKAYNAFKSDIWSMGVTFYNMLHHHQKYPFDYKDTKKMLKQMHSYPTHLRHRLKKDLPKEAIQLFETMLNPNERERASVNDICQNNWLRSKANK